MEGNLLYEFTVKKDHVLNMIKINSFYRGERIKDENGAHAARMQAGNDNNDILNDELSIAASDVATIITRNLGRCTLEETTVTDEGDLFIFKGVGATNFPLGVLKSSVENLIAVYMFDKALEGWMLVNMPNEVQALGQRSLADAEKLRQMLVERSKPVR